MKPLFIFTVVFLLAGICSVSAQDQIILKNRNTVLAKVIEVTSTEIKCQNSNGHDINIPKDNVLSIKYGNGTNQIINEEPPAEKRDPAEVSGQQKNRTKNSRVKNTQMGTDEIVFGINANAGGAIPLGDLGPSAPSINVELSKGNFNTEINIIYSIDLLSKAEDKPMGFGALAVFNYVWDSPIGPFYFGGGAGYIFSKGKNTMHDIAFGANIVYKYPLSSGMYFCGGAFVGGALSIVDGELSKDDSGFYLKPNLGVGYSF